MLDKLHEKKTAVGYNF